MSSRKLNELELTGWPLPDDWLIELGRISAVWIALENALELFIGKLAGFEDITDQRPFVLVRHTSFPQKLDMFCALCEHLKDGYPSLKKYDEVASLIRAAQKGRNRFLHNPISKNLETQKFELVIGSARGKVKTSVAELSLMDIRRVSIDIDKANCELYRLVLGVKLPTILERR